MKKTILMIIFITCIFISICPSGVIPEENQTILDNQTREYGPRCRWVPSKAQTSKALEAIYTFLKTEITPDWRNRQRKAIHCNFFQEEGGFNHDKYTYVLVLDGGTSYWRINYDIDKNKCFDFEVNGEA
jgi:hypothetical protein